MTIQSVGNYCPARSPLKTDSQKFRQGFGNLVGALKSGDLAQVALSGNMLQQVMAQFQTDLTNVQQTNNNNQNLNSTSVDFKNLLGAVNTAKEAIKAGNQDQISASQNALQQAVTQFQADLTTIQQANNNNPNLNSTQVDFQNLLSAIHSVLEAQKSGSPDQITAANDAMQKAVTQLQTDLPGLQQTQNRLQVNSANNGSIADNLLNFLAAVTGYGNCGQSKNNINISSLSLKA